MNLLDAALNRFRSTLCVLLLIIVAGVMARLNMTVETQPDINAPYLFVQVLLDGASPEDANRLLVRPLEKELRAIEGVEELRSTARESLAYALIEFETGVDMDQALIDTREAVDKAKAEFPADAEEPLISEISAVAVPVIVVTLTSDSASERELFRSAQRLKQRIETNAMVLSATMVGHREEVVEALISPERLAHYAITSDEMIRAIVLNNLLIPAGEIESGHGRFAVKVPGLIESAADVYALPLRADTDAVVQLGDIAEVRRRFKDPSRFTSVSGRPAISIEVSKRSGVNTTEIAEAVRALVEAERPAIAAGIRLDYAMDQSEFSRSMVSEMQGNIITAMALVMVIVLAALGFKSSLLVGMAIPFSLLGASILLWYLDYSFNFMVMFGMLLALGMLIDGSIVITEFADRKMAEGRSSVEAYRIAVQRMLWPVLASTLTTLAAFLPIMFWPGVSGDFMRYLPVTVFTVLSFALVYALLFAPVLGVWMGRTAMAPAMQRYLEQVETAAVVALPGLTGAYARLLRGVLARPLRVFVLSLLSLAMIFWLFARFNAGVEFFTQNEQKYGVVTVRAQGNLSVLQARALVQQVERRVLAVPGVALTYAASGRGGFDNSTDQAEDQIGSILVELRDPQQLERSSYAVFAEIRAVTADMPGILVNAKAFEGGPPVGKPIHLQLESANYDKLLAATRQLSAYLQSLPQLRDVIDSSPLPGIEWLLRVDRARAAQLGVNVLEVGRAVQLVTTGVKVGEYRPDDADDEVDIRVRYPASYRGLQALESLRVNSVEGPVPVNSFVQRQPRPRVDKLQRVNGQQIMTVKADVEEGVLVEAQVAVIQDWLRAHPLDPDLKVVFRGANEEQNKSKSFLSVAFSLALFLMFVLLVTQFNSFYQSALILSSVIMSTAGVLLGLLLTQSTFSVILTGVGIVALAGIVVNNNIVLIDTFNVVRREQPTLSVREAAVLASAQRLRPVFLTTVTTVLGLLPIASNTSVDLIARSIQTGGVISSFWVPLASAIVYGLVFSTLLTLLVTPVMLVLPERLRRLRRRV